MKKYGIIFYMLLVSSWVMAQETKLFLKDAVTMQPLPFAHVMVESLDGKSRHLIATGIDGSATLPSRGPLKVSISCMGYMSYLDTLGPGSSYTLFVKPAILDMDAVVITAQYAPRQVDKSIYPVRVISTAKINTKGAANLRDLLTDELSMRVSQDGALGSHLSLRGLSGEHIKFLIDGVPIIGRMNGNIDLSQLNLNNVEHVEIIEGPMSVIYGSNALAGVVNIITRDNLPGHWRSSLDAYTESVGTYNMGATTSFSRKYHSFSLNLGRNFFSGWSPDEPSRAKLWKPKRQYDGEVWHAYRKDGFRIKSSWRYFHELLLNKGSLLPPYYETAFDNHFITQRWTARTEINKNLGQWIRLEAMTALSGYDREKRTMFKDLTTLQQVVSGNDEDQDTTSFLSYMARVMTIHADPDARLEYQTGLDVNIESGTGKRMAEDAREIVDFAAFTSIKYRPWPTLEMQPGLRYGYNSRYSHPLVWSIHAKWNPFEMATIRASASKGFRAPALKELYLYFVDVNHNIRGNPELEAEHSSNVNLSATLTAKRSKLDWSAEVHLFDNRIRNIITLAQLDQSLYTYINVDNYYTRGAELKLQLAFYPWLSVKPGLSITGRSSFVNMDAKPMEELRYATDVSTALSIRPFSTDWELSAYYKWVGKLPQLYLNPSGQLSEGYIDRYHILDLSLSRSMLKRQLLLTAGAKNVFDNTAIDIMGGSTGVHGGSGGNHLAGYGRTWFIKANWTINRINTAKS